MGLTIQWAGIGEITRALDDLILQIRMDTKAALGWYGNTATTEMKANHDRDAHDVQRYVNRSWYLTNSIMFDVEDRGQTLRLRLYTPAWYAELVEHGTPRSQAYPFFWPPIRTLEPLAQQRVVQVLLEGLAKHEAWVKSASGRSARVRGTIMETAFTLSEISGEAA